MGDEGLANGKGYDDVQESGGALDKQSNSDFRLGDMTWIKLRGASWWPAQIVDENTISDNLKPRKGKRSDALVRLYGTYEYAYMNPVTSLLEFNDVLKESKGSQRQFFIKMLEQDLSKLQFKRKKARKANAKGSCVDMKNITPSKRATEEEDGLKKKPCYEDTLEKSEGSARRLKVMLDLGLRGPSGSPFLKNGQFLSILQ